MSWTILLLRDKIKIEIPFSTTVDLLKQKSSGGRRFKNLKVNDNEAKAFYSYRDTLYDQLGYLTTYENELIIRTTPNNSGTTIEFRMPRLRMIALGIVGIFILCFLIFAFPDMNLLWTSIILLILYLGIVVNLNSQFYYFKSDIEQIQENYNDRQNNDEWTIGSASR